MSKNKKSNKERIKAKIGDIEIEGPINNRQVKKILKKAIQKDNNKDKLQKTEVYLKWTQRLVIPVLLLFFGIVFKGIKLVDELTYLVDIVKLLLSG